MIETSQIPSPEEVMQRMTPRGEWTRSDLASWGVPFPPPRGWKEQLEIAYRSGQTVGVILECIGCREAKYFVDFDPYPVCRECQEYEREKYDREHEPQHPIRQKETPTFVERVMSAFSSKPKTEYKKEPIPSSIRWAVWERDNFTCKHCGSRKNLSVDHIIPESRGGKATMENCQTLCKSCNSRKGAR